MTSSSLIRNIVEEKMGEIPHFLLYAMLEILVIILLYIDGFVSFLSREIAKFFDLEIPCLLCTRIDHVLAHRNSTFYCNDVLCEDHMKDISSLAYCHVHKKLSDIQYMCDRCLIPYATEKEKKDSDSDRYKSLAGILHKDVDCFVEGQDQNNQKTGSKFRKKDEGLMTANGDSVIVRCSCCGEPLKARASSKFIRSSSTKAIIAPPTPSPRAPLPAWKNEDVQNPDLREFKIIPDKKHEVLEDEDVLKGGIQSREDIKAPLLPVPDTEDLTAESNRTPIFGRGNRFFGIPLTDSAHASPRFRYSKRMSLDKPELFLEANDLSSMNELDRLKTENVDRKSLMALYMELDEERSASAVAANNAMAMITRLQAEKAAVQMEALQYQRIMEEQAEYDQEAIQILRDLVLKREEEIRVLESELDAYRFKFGPIKNIGSEICEIDDEDYQDMKSQPISPCGEISECVSPASGDQDGANEHMFGARNMDESSLGFESDRAHLLNLLKGIEKNIIEPDMENQEEIGEGCQSKPVMMRELSFIRERLRVIEADSGFLKHTAKTLQTTGNAELLSEIAQHLRSLRSISGIPPQDADVDDRDLRSSTNAIPQEADDHEADIGPQNVDDHEVDKIRSSANILSQDVDDVEADIRAQVVDDHKEVLKSSTDVDDHESDYRPRDVDDHELDARPWEVVDDHELDARPWEVVDDHEEDLIRSSFKIRGCDVDDYHELPDLSSSAETPPRDADDHEAAA